MRPRGAGGRTSACWRPTTWKGATPDAAYVATLIDLAETLRDTKSRFRRSILFAIFTAEERGLLGSRYFVAHPTVPKAQIVADVNLDTLRPIFPLRSLTTLALDRSTLGDAAKQVGAARQLVRRSDQWNFLEAGIPAIAFVFGYDRGSKEEAIYREWYARRYHSPADDLGQPWDRSGAARFNALCASARNRRRRARPSSPHAVKEYGGSD